MNLDGDDAKIQILQFLVEQKQDKGLLPLYRVLTSRFNVRQSHALNHCFGIELVRNDKMNHIGDADTVNDSCFEQTEYLINGLVASHSNPAVNEVVHRIECRNAKLFADRAIWIQEFDDSEDVEEHMIDLSVFEHRGHNDDDERFHPNKLLDGESDSNYLSKAGTPSADWIVFMQSERREFYPTQIMVRNDRDNYGIQSADILWSADGLEYQELTQLHYIRKRSKKRQWFPVMEEQRRFMKFIKLKIVSNHGNGSMNSFYEFGLSGFAS